MKTGSWGAAVPGGFDRRRHLPFNIAPVVDPMVITLSVKVLNRSQQVAFWARKDYAMHLLYCSPATFKKPNQPDFLWSRGHDFAHEFPPAATFDKLEMQLVPVATASAEKLHK